MWKTWVQEELFAAWEFGKNIFVVLCKCQGYFPVLPKKKYKKIFIMSFTLLTAKRQ